MYENDNKLIIIIPIMKNINIYINLDKITKIHYNIHRRKKVKHWKNI